MGLDGPASASGDGIVAGKDTVQKVYGGRAELETENLSEGGTSTSPARPS